MLTAGKRGLLFQMSYASASKYGSVGLRMLRGFALAMILGPTGFGVWTSMRLVMLFGSFSHAGARPGMVRQATLAEAGGELEEAARLRSTASVLNLVGALTLGTLVAGAALLGAADRSVRFAWLGLAAALVLRDIWLFHQSLLASRRRYAWRTSLNLLLALLTTGLGIAAALQHGLLGFVLALGACYALMLLIAPLWGNPLPRLAFERETARGLLAVGLPVMLSNLLKTLLWNVDKLLLWLLAGKAMLGIYALQSQITNALMLLPAGISEVFYPHLLGELGRIQSPTVARRYLVRATDLLVRCMLPVLAVAFFALHLPIRWWMPEYHDAIAPGIVLVLATFFPVAGSLPGNVLVALGGQRTLLGISFAAVAVAALGVTTAITSGAGYLGVAAGTALGLATRCGLSIGAAMQRAELDRAGRSAFLGRLAVSFGLLLTSVAAAHWIVPDRHGSLGEDAIFTLGRCAVAIALLAPWTLSALRRAAAGAPAVSKREAGQPR